MAVAGEGQARALSASSFVFTLQEQGGDVVGDGSGTINTSSLTSIGTDSAQAYIDAGHANVAVGPATTTVGSAFVGITGPTSAGTGSLLNATSGTGDEVAIDGFDSAIFVPTGYISGAALSDSATWVGSSYSSLGLTPGIYEWTWGSGRTAGSVILNVIPVPEPSQYGWLVFGAFAGFSGWKKFSRLAV